MALKFNYNKTTIQQFKRQLAIREKALPILKNKETALRQEVKTLTHEIAKLQADRTAIETQLQLFQLLWASFPSIVALKGVKTYQKKIIGVKVPEMDRVEFEIADISWWNLEPWVPAAIDITQKVIELDLNIQTKTVQLDLLNTARKKTTQKVNLYEKVQIPAYAEAILKIKRFLEDKENISKAGQKIMKKKKEMETT